MFLIICSSDIETNPGPKKNTKISICYWYLNGTAVHNFSKVSLLQAIATKHEYDIKCLLETFLDSLFNAHDNQINIEKYNLLRADHTNDNKGAICIYFKENLILKRDDLCNLTECLLTEIGMGKKKCFFTCLYRSPSQSYEDFDTFCSNFNLFLSNIKDLNPAFSIVIGDFNARNSKW